MTIDIQAVKWALPTDVPGRNQHSALTAGDEYLVEYDTQARLLRIRYVPRDRNRLAEICYVPVERVMAMTPVAENVAASADARQPGKRSSAPVG